MSDFSAESVRQLTERPWYWGIIEARAKDRCDAATITFTTKEAAEDARTDLLARGFTVGTVKVHTGGRDGTDYGISCTW